MAGYGSGKAGTYADSLNRVKEYNRAMSSASKPATTTPKKKPVSPGTAVISVEELKKSSARPATKVISVEELTGKKTKKK
jgi:hypothetical protein